MEKVIPEFFNNLLVEQYGKEIAEKITENLQKDKKVTLRVNKIKASKEEIIEEFNKNNIVFKEIDWYKDAFII